MTSSDRIRVSLLTAGKDSHYALGLLEAFAATRLDVEFVANDEMASSPHAGAPNVTYLNLRGDQADAASLWRKVRRLSGYYVALLRYAATTRSRLFHILWFNRFEWFDNTALIIYYRLLGKQLVYTAHNVDTSERDGKRSVWKRASLKFLYRNVDHIFVHTVQMKAELTSVFGVVPERVTVVPFPVNNVTPRSDLTRAAARQRLGLTADEKILLFFGNIAPYKGLDVLVDALEHAHDCRLIIAGRVKDSADYWRGVQETINRKRLQKRIVVEDRYIPEENVEVYFKAADALVAPYRRVSQSGVVFLSYGFGLPVIVSDAGGLAEAVTEGDTGFVFRAEDANDLAVQIQRYFDSDLYRGLERRRADIICRVNEKHSWRAVADAVERVYNRIASSVPYKNADLEPGLEASRPTDSTGVNSPPAC